MAITSWSGVPYGCVFNIDIPGHPSVHEIRSDGAVDKAFCQPNDDTFIPTIDDPRISDFVQTGLPPESDWEHAADGHWSHGHQQLWIRDGRVTLKSWIEENNDIVTHHIEAPYQWASGKIQKLKSTEGFRIT